MKWEFTMNTWKFTKKNDPRTIGEFRAKTFMEALQAVSVLWFHGAIVKDWKKVITMDKHQYRLMRGTRANQTIGTVNYRGRG